MINFSNFFITPPKRFQLSLGVAGKEDTDFVSFVTILPIFAAKRPDKIYKSGSKTDCGNYRPISVISAVAKILEKIIHDQLFDFKLILANQQSFCQSMPC